MINYIIIENEFKYIEIYRSIIKEIMQDYSLIYKTIEFDSYNKGLSKLIHDNTYKIYLIDIGLNSNKSGIDIAKEIRNVDHNSEILFITRDDLLFEVVFKNVHKVYSFISKNYKMAELLKEELDEIVFNYTRNIKYFVLDKKGDYKVLINDILYIYRETEERKVYVVTEKNKYAASFSLKEILEYYPKDFIQIHRACLINPRKINMYNWCESYFVLENGEQIFMCSKKYKDNVV